ncbi:PE-PPE domain-containing protein [Mycolicibacterium sp. S2-37]|uniref:PE-PPE domain-containing protein n=1 Tax=Mycolicibacterium sp. S2-37 TaxID=2810297 RepID=UPI001F5E432E|nr:PE-PPE domain-containing protein [Mycolicibacterium sp. S2-37]
MGVVCLSLLAAAVLALASTVSSAVSLLATTALVMSGTFTPTPPPWFVDMAKNQFIVPTHPGRDIDRYIAVTTPEQAWPVTGFGDYPFGTSVRIGVSDLEAAMATYGSDDLIIFGHSQSSVISYIEKRKLAEQYPIGTPAPDIDFVTIGTLNLPNGGVMTRFWGAYLPFVDFYFNGPAPNDTQFDTDIITQRYDGFADFPMYPVNLLAVANAVAGFFYTHEDYEAVTLAGDPAEFFVGSQGDTDYYFFPTKDLPLFGPLRGLGVPEPLIDIVEPMTTFFVELGYRRDIPPWVPTPAQLIPVHDPADVIDDFAAAVEETVDNTRALIGAYRPPAMPTMRAPATPAPDGYQSVTKADSGVQREHGAEPEEAEDTTAGASNSAESVVSQPSSPAVTRSTDDAADDAADAAAADAAADADGSAQVSR